MARRGENIRKRKDGRWEGRYTVYGKETGCRRVHSVYAASYAEVKKRLNTAKQNADQSDAESNVALNITFQNIARKWLAEIQKSKKHSTYVKYKIIYETHLQKNIGELSVTELNGETLRTFFERKISYSISDSLQKSISCVLNQIIRYASTHYSINLAKYPTNNYHTEKKPLEILNPVQQARLLRCLYENMDRTKMGIVVCISTGLRLGEICALKWEDIDMDGKFLRVNTTVQRIAVDNAPTKTILLEGTPKSIFSKREIPLSDEVIRLLWLFYYHSEKYVIGKNRPMEPRTYQNRFRKYLAEAGIEERSFHILRHTFATNCIANGADIKSLSELLGHSDVKITLNRYVHPDMETKRQHLNAVSAVYGKYLRRDSK